MRPVQLLGLLVAGALVAAACAVSEPSSREPDAAASVQPAATLASDATAPVAGTTATEAVADTAAATSPISVSSARVDLNQTGNRVTSGTGSFTTVAPVAVGLGDRRARWILPTGPAEWTVFLDDGGTVIIDVNRRAEPLVAAGLPAGSFSVDAGPPMLRDGEFVAATDANAALDDPLPDSRVVSDDERSFVLGGPSGRYAHGVLGDSIEATTIEAIDADGAVDALVRLDDPDVFEAISPMLADVDDDGDLEIVATVSNSQTGARVAVYGLDGTPEAETPAIGRGSRWRNLLGVAPVGPDGQVELVDVQTPHIGGILQFFRADGSGTLRLVASTGPYSTHSIGSRNLDLGIISDADGDGRLDVLLPSQDQRSLAVVTRDETVATGARETFRVDLGARLITNVAATTRGGSVAYAVGLDDGRVLVWPGSG